MDDLSSLLGDKPENLTLSPDDVLGESKPSVPASPTALKHDRWSLRMGRQWANSDIGTVATKRVAEDTDRNLLAADMFSVAWETNPVLVDGDCLCQDRREFLSAMLESPEYKSVHRSTALDELSSEIAAGAFTKQWLDYVAETQQDSPDKKPSESDDLAKEASIARHVRQALGRANREVSEHRDATSALGIGGDGNNPATKMATDEIRKHFGRIRNNRQLRRIMELSGRYMRLAQTAQSTKLVHGADEVVGLELGNDLSRILPSELVLLTDEDTELEFMRRFVEKSLLCREYKEAVSEARGPIVLVVDESGSMSGEPVATAKAIALAILWVARHQNRWACLVGFSGGEYGNFLVIPPGSSDTADLLDWLSHFYGGGTDMDVPLVVLPKRWNELGCPEGRTDIIQITDAQAHVPDRMADTFNAWKREHQVKMRTIVIGNDGGDLEKVSDAIWTNTDLDVGSAGVRDALGV